jgi:sulfur carrier protein
MIKVNGEIFNITEIPLVKFLEENGYDPKRIAVERNEMIVPKAEYDSCILNDGDTVEIVSLVGGG